MPSYCMALANVQDLVVQNSKRGLSKDILSAGSTAGKHKAPFQACGSGRQFQALQQYRKSQRCQSLKANASKATQSLPTWYIVTLYVRTPIGRSGPSEIPRDVPKDIDSCAIYSMAIMEPDSMHPCQILSWALWRKPTWA